LAEVQEEIETQRHRGHREKQRGEKQRGEKQRGREKRGAEGREGKGKGREGQGREGGIGSEVSGALVSLSALVRRMVLAMRSARLPCRRTSSPS
jgi:hypothetical protein